MKTIHRMLRNKQFRKRLRVTTIQILTVETAQVMIIPTEHKINAPFCHRSRSYLIMDCWYRLALHSPKIKPRPYIRASL
ncbi:hypothetical protein CCP2SC5_940002 [Azospirillaceae bacterium]